MPVTEAHHYEAVHQGENRSHCSQPLYGLTLRANPTSGQPLNVMIEREEHKSCGRRVKS